MNTIREYLQKNGYATVSDRTIDNLESWMEWYKGDVDTFHHYNVYNGIVNQRVDRKTLGMAKYVAEDWANLLMNEKVNIVTNNDALNKAIAHIFEYNNFITRANQLVELAFALGTGAFVEYYEGNGEIAIDYVRADMIYPISWENGDITECAFGSHRNYGGRECIYLQIHEIGENGNYVISNHYVDENNGEEIWEEEDSVMEEVDTNSTTPLFQIIFPNIVNNVDLDSPMGISVYGNAIDQLMTTDLVYDSYANEFILGKKRITVPLSMAQQMKEKSGVARPVFDAKDTVFYAVPGTEDNGGAMKEIDMTLRAQEHELAIQRQLDLLSFKCGLGNGRYHFENGAVKTATEVISDKGDLFQNLKKHQKPIRSALRGIVLAIASVLNIQGELEITIDLDDSVIEDKKSERDQDRQDMAAGIMTALEYRMKWYNEDEATAKKRLAAVEDLME